MIVDELQNSLEFFGQVYREEGGSLILLNSIESKICDVFNHIVICHRVIAERRSEAKTLFGVLKRGSLLAEAQQASDTLLQTIAIQKELTSLKTKVMFSYAKIAFGEPSIPAAAGSKHA